uniref:G protein subunit alpha z n=1 Tax=Accipiter nisus TaxID=211598 RepID=A0A8B9MDU2_9AVES
MGCRQSSEEKEAARRSRRIDRHLRSESQRQRREIKLLLLGTSNSGKSTIVKQMKIIHSGGFNLEACKEYKPLIIYNAIDSLTRIIRVWWFVFLFVLGFVGWFFLCVPFC